MGWMIGVVILVVTNVWTLWVIRRLRASATNSAAAIARYQATEDRIRESVYKAREADWRRQSGFYTGIKDIEYRSTADLVSDCLDELTWCVTDYRRLWARCESNCSCGWADDPEYLEPPKADRDPELRGCCTCDEAYEAMHDLEGSCKLHN